MTTAFYKVRNKRRITVMTRPTGSIRGSNDEKCQKLYQFICSLSLAIAAKLTIIA